MVKKMLVDAGWWAVSSNDMLPWVDGDRFEHLVKYRVHACGSYFDRDGCWRHRSVLGNVGPLHRCRSCCSRHVLKHKQNTHTESNKIRVHENTCNTH